MAAAGVLRHAIDAGSGGFHRRTWIEDGSVVVKWDVGNLRQHARDVSDQVYILLSARPLDGVLHGMWKATVRDLDGVLTGTVDVPVAEHPIDVASAPDFTPTAESDD